ncbi:MAG: sodium:proton antiporter [Proteobacteria bacterium]|jgi:Na+/H+ antiporter NhaD/arsenite permease-like protein|nr:sodium:proton antiporter [Pseudomonadota bacterium]
MFFASFLPLHAQAAVSSGELLQGDWYGPTALVFFVMAYGFVLLEERIHLRKSKPVTIAAGLIWIFVMLAYKAVGQEEQGAHLLRESLLEYAELMLFLLSAMTFVNAMDDRGLFRALRAKLVSKGFSLRTLFWLCGGLAFIMSPIADNLTTALVLGAVSLAVGSGNAKFVSVSFINIVVAANAGGAFSPFGDITTLMVWQKGLVHFGEFFLLFIPSLISWILPAFVMSLAVPKSAPEPMQETVRIKKGGKQIALLFLSTIAMTVLLHQFLHIPPFMGMVTGLGFLKVYGFFIRHHELRKQPDRSPADETKPFDIFVNLSRIEWDTLMFFYGVMMCVGGIGAFGYLHDLSSTLYGTMGDTSTHILVGFLSAIIDNIPVMFAVLNMGVDHSLGQWLLVTLTAGIGGSLLSIGSAAGVALMGQARGTYTFMSHLKWSWIILIGYLAGIGSHLLINTTSF